ncbi:hypothetical protein ABT336_05410 [Micromonospora sp. NPDC000207]|uniref:hypothetical protein n=1 Tax=Micromonospora sp. NPDC000207 TaxID=3154246 RepID=UPI003319BF46
MKFAHQGPVGDVLFELAEESTGTQQLLGLAIFTSHDAALLGSIDTEEILHRDEIWLILHHENCTRYLENAKRARDHLRRLVEGWDKTKLAFAGFRDGVDTATAYARALGEPPDANPSTAIWRLVEELRDPR